MTTDKATNAQLEFAHELGQHRARFELDWARNAGYAIGSGLPGFEALPAVPGYPHPTEADVRATVGTTDTQAWDAYYDGYIEQMYDELGGVDSERELTAAEVALNAVPIGATAMLTAPGTDTPMSVTRYPRGFRVLLKIETIPQLVAQGVTVAEGGE